MIRFPDPSPADLVMVKAEQLAQHPDANATVGALLHLTGAVPDLAGLRGHVAARLDGLPCLTHVLSGDGPGARWVAAVPDMTGHIRSQQVGGGPASAEAAVRGLLREPWPRQAPAWRMVLLHGHVPDGFALLYLTHHAVQDGANIASVLEALFGPRLLSEQFSALARALPPTARPSLRQAARSTVTLLRHARSHHLWQSASHPLSSRRHTLWAQAPSACLRSAARASGASTNDVYLTALIHAITQWAEDAWPRAAGPAFPVMVPVNLRTPDEVAAPGNRLSLTWITLPGGTMPVGQRLARVRDLTPDLKSAGHRAVLRAALTRLPWRLVQCLIAASTAPGRLTVCASYLVVRQSLRYGMAAVHRIDPIMCCPPGVPMAVAAVTYGHTTSASFRIDTALPGADSLPERWRQALADLATETSSAVAVDPAPAGGTLLRPAPSVLGSLFTWLARRSTGARVRRR